MSSSDKPLWGLRLFFLIGLGGWFVFNLVQSIGYVIADYSPVPIEDYWRIPQFWAATETIHWSNLWQQHNEHRIIFPELVNLTDMIFFHGRMYLSIAFNGACYMGIWIVLACAAYEQKNMLYPMRETALLIAGVVIAWKGCSSVIATPFQIQFTLLQLVSTLALFFLSKLAESGKAKDLIAVIVCAIVCTYSSANGMLLWFVLIAAAIYLRIRIRQAVVLCLTAAIFTGLFFFQYHFLPSAIRTNIKHPVQAIAFICSYFSMPFGGSGPRTVGFGIGAINLLLMVACFRVAFSRGLLRSRLAVVLFGSYLFTFASTVLTALGRMDLNDFEFVQAKAWRYVTVPTVSWALLAIALVWLSGSLPSRAWSPAIALALSVGFGFGFYSSSDWQESTRSDFQNAQVTAIMFRNGVFDPNQVRTIFPDPEFVRVNLQVLEKNHKSIFARGADKWIGGDARSLPLNDATASGMVTRVYPVPGGVEVFGWADSASLTDDHATLFVNDQNVIIGFGRRPSAGFPITLSTWDTPNQLAFVGYISSAQAPGRIAVRIRTYHGKSYQPLDDLLQTPSFTQLAARSDTDPLPAFAWVAASKWTQGGYTVDPENGPAPKSAIYASWSGSDANVGAIQSEAFANPADSCLVLPVLHGRSAYGQSLEIRNASNENVIAKLPFLDGRTIWERWRIPLPTDAHKIKITADDEGTGFNQWLAVAQPERCPVATR